MVVPNSKFVTDIVINWSHIQKKTRFHINVGVAYGSDKEIVNRILLQCADGQEKISANKVKVNISAFNMYYDDDK